MINNMLNLIIFAFLNALFVSFIDFCFNEGNIFEKYYLFILKYKEKHPFIFKILGGCIFCFGTWIYIFHHIFLSLKGELDITYIFLGMGLNYFILKKISED